MQSSKRVEEALRKVRGLPSPKKDPPKPVQRPKITKSAKTEKKRKNAGDTTENGCPEGSTGAGGSSVNGAGTEAPAEPIRTGAPVGASIRTGADPASPLAGSCKQASAAVLRR